MVRSLVALIVCLAVPPQHHRGHWHLFRYSEAADRWLWRQRQALPWRFRRLLW